MNKESAEKLSILIMQLNAKIDESVAFVRDHDKEGLFKDYHKIAGNIMGALYLDIEEKLWTKYPELRPKQMDGPYDVNPKIFEPRFYPENEENT